MKKLYRALTALFAAVAMLFAGLAGASIAFAAEPTTYQITAPDNGHTYEVYQIFTGDLADGKLSNVKWGQNAKLTGETKVGDLVPESVLTELTGATGTDREKLTIIEKYVDLNSANVFRTITGGNSVTVDAGYYLIKDVDGALDGKDDAYTTYIVEVVGNVTITPKSDVPTSEKKVKETNDSTGNTTDWQDGADYDFGDDVPFRLTGTVSKKLADYKSAYQMTFHDKFDAKQFSFNNDVTVEIGSTTVPQKVGDHINYMVNPNPTDGDSFDVHFDDIKNLKAADGSAITVDPGATVTVYYTAELLETATVGSAGNKNTSHMTFSNNPNSDQGGETGKTPDDTVIVFTYKTTINKVKPDKTDPDKTTPLAGAEFTLQKKYKTLPDGVNLDTNKDWKQEGTGKNAVYWKTIAAGKNKEGTTFMFSGLDAGDYRLTETKTPDGYNSIAPIEFTITADYVVDEEKSADGLKFNSLSGNALNGEITLPNSTDGTLTANVVNKPGSSLPSTGGMGTTILYVAGIAVVVFAVCGLALVLRKRQSVR